MRLFALLKALAGRGLDLLIWIGLMRRRTDRTIRWPVSVDRMDLWWVYLTNPGDQHFGWFGLFRNVPGVVKWQTGRLLPRRWGFRILGLEIGDRG